MITLDFKKMMEVVNKPFYPLLTDNSRYLVLRGGAGSGKSEFCAQKVIFRVLKDMSRGVNHNFLILRKTIPAVKKSIFPLMREYINRWDLEELVTINKTEMTFKFINGSQILMAGLDDPEKIKSIFGLTSIWLEEANEFTLDDFRQLDLRLRGRKDTYYQIMMSFNPISKLTWVYNEFFAREKKNATLHHSTYKDNRFLDEEYEERLEALVNEDRTYYKIYTLGEWGSLEHIIYSNWGVVDKFPDVYDDTCYGLDWGYNHPSALIQVARVGERDIYVREVIYGKKLTNQDLIDKMDVNVDRSIPIYCDSAMPGNIEELSRAGYNTKGANRKKHSVKEGLDFVKRMDLHITADSVNLLKEIQNYKYRETKDGVIDEPVKFNDDGMDAMRYAIFSHWGSPRSYIAYIPLEQSINSFGR